MQNDLLFRLTSNSNTALCIMLVANAECPISSRVGCAQYLGASGEACPPVHGRKDIGKGLVVGDVGSEEQGIFEELFLLLFSIWYRVSVQVSRKKDWGTVLNYIRRRRR